MRNERFFSWSFMTGLVTGIIGLAYLVLGVWLAALGGSPWYVLFGSGYLLSGIFIARRHASGIWLYLLTFLLCCVWSVWEVGLDGWQLMPRLFVMALLGVWCSLPLITRQVMATRGNHRTGTFAGLVYVVAIMGIFYSGW